MPTDVLKSVKEVMMFFSKCRKISSTDIILTKYFSVATGMDEHKINALDFSGKMDS
jgi:hypothetical protein